MEIRATYVFTSVFLKTILLHEMYTITKRMAIFLNRLLHFPVHISGSKIGVSSNKLENEETDSQTLKTNL